MVLYWREASKFLQEILRGSFPRWLSLLGRSGTGKTLLAHTIRQSLSVSGLSCQFWKWTSIVTLLREGHYDLKQQLARAPVLIVDDLFAGQSSDFTQAYADELADHRLGKWTLFTSNETLEQIGDRNNRVRSRMQRDRGTVVEILNTPDFCA